MLDGISMLDGIIMLDGNFLNTCFGSTVFSVFEICAVSMAQLAVHYCHQDHFIITEPLLFETYTVLILSLALSFQLHNMVCSIAGAS